MTSPHHQPPNQIPNPNNPFYPFAHPYNHQITYQQPYYISMQSLCLFHLLISIIILSLITNLQAFFLLVPNRDNTCFY